MKLKLAVIADPHLKSQFGCRRGDIAEHLLDRAVQWINRHVQPDVAILLGDIIDKGELPEAVDDLKKMNAVWEQLSCPKIAIPGNHDHDVGRFYTVFDHPGNWLDLGDFRLVPFADKQVERFWATREPAEFDKMKRARHGFDGHIIAIQHVPVFTPDSVKCHYNYTNAAEVVSAMHANKIALVLAGHDHAGVGPFYDDGFCLAAPPALCQETFPFWICEWDGQKLDVETHELKLPATNEWFDWHVHSPLAYCSRNMDFDMAQSFGRDMGLKGLMFAEHTTQLRKAKQGCDNGSWFGEGVEGARKEDDRRDEYRRLLSKHLVSPNRGGLEIDCDQNGSPYAESGDFRDFDVTVGSIHRLKTCHRDNPNWELESTAEHLELVRKFAACGIKILGHPFRVFTRYHKPIPQSRFADIVDVLKQSGVAAELSFLYGPAGKPIPPDIFESLKPFYRMCIEAGVKIALGSDAHRICDVGEFHPHIQFLESIGIAGDLSSILWKPES